MKSIKEKFKIIKGFTLVELIMVIVIIGLLAAIVVPRFGGQGDDARIANGQANLANLRSAVEVYRLEQGTLPASLANLSPQYMRAIPEEALPGLSGAGVPTAALTEGPSPQACSNAGGWIYETDTGEVKIARDTTGCPVGSSCAGDDPCNNW